MTRGLLVVFGLPGTGKSALADALGQRLAAVRLSVDDAEEALLAAGLSPGWTTGVAAYEAVGAFAAQNLRAGATVVVDAVNDSEPARETWRRAAVSAGAEVRFVLTICTDEAEHRRRLAGRTRPYTHVREPAWDDLQRRAEGFEPWAGPHTVVDTVHPLPDSVARVLAATPRRASTAPAQRDFPSPTLPFDDERAVLLDYLDFFRGVLLAKVTALSPADQRGSRLPSGWTPLELVHHLRHVERRWLEWGFEGRPVPDPWADEVDGRWHTEQDHVSLTVALADQAQVTIRIVRAHGLDEIGRPGARWDGAPPAPLRRVLLHLLQEYARHTGHLDIVAELANGTVGEDA